MKKHICLLMWPLVLTLFLTACASQKIAKEIIMMKRNEKKAGAWLTAILLLLPILATGCSASKQTEQPEAGTDTAVVTDSASSAENETTQTDQPESNPGERGEMGGNRGGNGGSTDKSGDTELQTMIAEIVPQFELLSYTDADSGITLQYYLFTPAKEAENYPLLQFIPDSSAVGRGDEAVLTQGWGGLIWATAEEQAKHPCYVLVPVFTEVVVDDNFNTSEQIAAEKNLIDHLCATEPIDTNRIYTTGQSMGGMASFHMNLAYPDLFAASLFVGSQWNIDIMQPLEEKNFFYVVSAGDSKASAGQAELMDLFDADGVKYAAGEWSAQEGAATQSNLTQNLIDQDYNANFVTFELGTTLADGQSSGGNAGEHMTSFDFAYRLEAVRDWLFAQSK